ncbi:2-nitropropane dioxygenase NPD [Desulfovibrio sp. X2]|uniref:NAD(P)H-dependent flavin oxidoreductase n=1 Tax=Desulfovibrio sp. X2 TaxID=941449 RepID=UPI000358B123|nr:nitronate monooxygenase family protein [Desulfovibrio sp. X2]EPR41603.1 2-nitropropane dioxygenase NPD [Desulfovibrio sp. X2]
MALPRLVIGDLNLALPIVQGGMGIGVSLSSLASAVAREGGVGIIATAGIGWDEPDFKTDFVAANSRALARHIRRARSLSDGVIGVNIMVAQTNYDALVETAVAEGADIIFSGAGLPLSLPKHVEGKSAPKLVPIVSSARAAQIICKKWKQRYSRLPDAVVVEGPMAGGHLGFRPEQVTDPEFALERLIPAVVEAVRPFEEESGRRIPVLAAGGVFTGADILKFLRLGASGVQMGTRFVATEECDAAPEFKQAYLNAKEGDLELIKSPVGLPGRAIMNPFVRDMRRGDKEPSGCIYHCLQGCECGAGLFCISEALIDAKKGDMKNGLIFAGRNAYRVDRIIPVRELVAALQAEYETACAAEGETV